MEDDRLMVRRVRAYLVGLAAGLALLLAAGQAQAGEDGQCRQCHLSQASRTLGQLAWQGPLEQGWLLPCPGRRAVQDELWATESLLTGLSAQLPALARRGHYVEPWRQALHQARSLLAQALAEPLEDGARAGERLAQVRGLAKEGVLAPLLEGELAARGRWWWGLMALGGLALAWAWLLGLRRALPGEPGERVFNRVKAGRLS